MGKAKLNVFISAISLLLNSKVYPQKSSAKGTFNLNEKSKIFPGFEWTGPAIPYG